MFKFIKFVPSSYIDSLSVNPNETYKCNLVELKNDKILEHENFERTFAGIGLTNILNLEKRSSWTHKLKFRFKLPSELQAFMNQNNIRGMSFGDFTMLKYEPGDFFLNHCDTDLSNYKDGDHKYTCLIFCPFSENNEILEGGELILKHPEGLYDIKFDPAVETRQNRFVMVIFSIDMYHEVLPIIKGSRWVLKKPLFDKFFTKGSKEDTDDEGELCDVGY
jgi:hypothetical protein